MLQHLEIHWFSIINSFVTFFLLTGFLAKNFHRILKNDFIKYSRDQEAMDDKEETGWKYINGDVFRFPPLTSPCLQLFLVLEHNCYSCKKIIYLIGITFYPLIPIFTWSFSKPARICIHSNHLLSLLNPNLHHHFVCQGWTG